MTELDGPSLRLLVGKTIVDVYEEKPFYGHVLVLFEDGAMELGESGSTGRPEIEWLEPDQLVDRLWEWDAYGVRTEEGMSNG